METKNLSKFVKLQIDCDNKLINIQIYKKQIEWDSKWTKNKLINF